MAKKQGEDVGRIIETVDHEEVTKILDRFDVPEASRSMVHGRLDELIVIVKNLEDDLGVDAHGNLSGIRPQDQREAFRKMAEKLEVVANEMSGIDAARQRYIAREREAFLAPAGAKELRRALGATLTSIFEPAFLRAYEIEMPEWYSAPRERGRVDRSPPMHPDYEFLFEREALPIAIALLKRLSSSILQAGESLARNTPRGGPRPKPTIEMALTNLVALWWQAFDGGGPVYFDADHPELLVFCQSLGRVLGIGAYCTETHLKRVVKEFNRRFRRKPTRKTC